MSKIKKDILDAMNEQFIFSLSPDDATFVALDFVKKWVEKAIDETKGYYSDTEYVTGKSKEDFMKENGLSE
jgi:hypothetical protein